jgi:anti-anti-sigma regulatory factor
VESARIRARLERQYVVVPVAADLDDAGVPRLGEQLDAIEPSTDVVVDMSQVGRCTDDGWRVLSEATDRLLDADGSLTLSRLRPEVRAQLRASSYNGRLKVRRRDR